MGNEDFQCRLLGRHEFVIKYTIKKYRDTHSSLFHRTLFINIHSKPLLMQT